MIREYCVRHGYGSFYETPYGLVCIDCAKKAGELPQDYEVCGDCGFDHSYEQQEAAESHRAMNLPKD